MSQTSNYDFLDSHFPDIDDDSKADKFFDVLTEVEEKKNLIAYSPDVAAVSSTLTMEEEVPETNSENKDPIESKRKVSSAVKAKKDTPVIRKVLNELKNHQIQHETNTDHVATPKELLNCFEKLQIDSKRKQKGPLRATQLFDGLVLEKQDPKPHRMTTRLDAILKTPVLKLRNRSIQKQLETSFDSEASETQPSEATKIISDNAVSSSGIVANRTVAVKRNASPLNSTRKFMSLAEQVQHFHKDTPDRFRSRPKKPYRPEPILPRHSVVPKTPNLTTKFRSRPSYFPNEKEREDQELEEIKKHQIKAHPINEKILKGPCLNLKKVIEKKPQTVPEPFHLTEVKKKEPPAQEVFHFKAQPVPLTILQRPVGIPPKKVSKPTTPQTPHIKVPVRLRVEAKSSSLDESNASSQLFSPPRNTRIQPFSFDEKMKEMLRRKEETIKKIIEEEKKIHNSFKAHPMPAYKDKLDKSVKQEKTIHRIEPQPFNLTQPKERKPVEEEMKPIRTTPFKATPATVIKKKPFVPVKPKHEILTPGDFYLNTEKRAMERQKFDEMIKKREEEHAEILKKRQEEEEKLAQQQYLEDRKKAEFRATPVPRPKPFEIHGADPTKLTMPHSPAFTVKKTKENKEN